MGVRAACDDGIAGFHNASAMVSNVSAQVAQTGSAEKSMTANQLPLEIFSLAVRASNLIKLSANG